MLIFIFLLSKFKSKRKALLPTHPQTKKFLFFLNVDKCSWLLTRRKKLLYFIIHTFTLKFSRYYSSVLKAKMQGLGV